MFGADLQTALPKGKDKNIDRAVEMLWRINYDLLVDTSQALRILIAIYPYMANHLLRGISMHLKLQ